MRDPIYTKQRTRHEDQTRRGTQISFVSSSVIELGRRAKIDLLLAFSFLKSGDGTSFGSVDRFFKLLLSDFSIEKRYLFLVFLEFGVTTRVALGKSGPRFSVCVFFLGKESGILWVLHPQFQYPQFQNRDQRSSPINNRGPP
ncbi:hypothetical protein MRB53_031165 [Persea americana]|uniref:Uncharacterized protein n=1 Tax=Persea americana TaxID=3435 RepID=A0ACC2KNE5_PERAE|nr:hypothetical protein MRB53_031165 [Persea americana]